MAVTQLKRKTMHNFTDAKNRVNTIKRLTKRPIIKNVDVEAIKASFNQQ